MKGDAPPVQLGRDLSAGARPSFGRWGEGGPKGRRGDGLVRGLDRRLGLSLLSALSVGGACPLVSSVNNRPSSRSGALGPAPRLPTQGSLPALSSPVPQRRDPFPTSPGSHGRQGHHTHRKAVIPLPPPGLAVASATLGGCTVPRGRGGRRDPKMNPPSAPSQGPRTPGPSACGPTVAPVSWLPCRGLRPCWLAATTLQAGGLGSAGEGV